MYGMMMYSSMTWLTPTCQSTINISEWKLRNLTSIRKDGIRSDSLMKISPSMLLTKRKGVEVCLLRPEEVARRERREIQRDHQK